VFKDICKDDAVEGPGGKWLADGFDIRCENFIEDGTCLGRHCGHPFDPSDTASGKSLLQMLAQAASTAAHVEDGSRSSGNECGDIQPLVGEVSRVVEGCHGLSQESSW
jgi:hypothetical protein